MDVTVRQPKKRLTRLSLPWEVLLLKTFTACYAHLASKSDAKSMFQDSLGNFLSAIATEAFHTIQKSNCNTSN